MLKSGIRIKLSNLESNRLFLIHRKELVEFEASNDPAPENSSKSGIKIEELKKPSEIIDFTPYLNKKIVDSLVKNNARFVIARTEDCIVGCMVIQNGGSDYIDKPFVFNFRVDDGYTYLSKNYVKPNFRNLGIGKKLYLRSFEITRELRNQKIMLIVDYDNNVSLALMRKFRFKVTGAIWLFKIGEINLILKSNSFLKIELLLIGYRLFRKLLILFTFGNQKTI